ncbi:MAG: endonuclease MutS2 [Ignavibacteriota bacterium]|nr:MAG: endonuclease MutS2 [Chlorobiota bacterium]MBE7477983.1 endonuclease MutS2 [Ignavibacteriales bacterium]MBL1123486.1 endonuclease MutS2 [Ignavibacteriota bacterium]MCE7857465.1 endonuclease MutS2 [Ignavibacteria bacterium CHB3]MEB2296824.1 endonuclease MutS2 [Ignavibacteria bacterium]GJQ42476.1 MAG: endonuclease MutS2 [Ignavibacteriaceae bacterium]
MMDKVVLDKLEFHKVLSTLANYSSTETGRKQILGLIPTFNLNKILKEGQTVSEAKEILIRNIPPQIDFIPDIFESISQSKIEGVVLSAKKILEILKLLKNSRSLYQFLKNNSSIAPLLSEQLSSLFNDKLLENHIEKVIDENGDIKEKASQKLSEIRKQIREKQNSLVKSISSIMKTLETDGIVREDYLTLRDGRMVIPVKAEHKRQIRGFIHSESATGQTVYIEPEQTLELNNEIITLGFAEKREIERLLKDVTALIGRNSDKIKDSLLTISYVDTVFARAKYSIEIIGSFPTIKNDLDFHINDARHPVLLKKLGRDKTIPLNFKLDEQRVIVITGPNAGGKTVVLKTIGLLSLLLQSGIHIPVDPDSNFHLFNNVLVDIGDEQSLEDDLSTFSSHLTNLKNILSVSDENTLVLLDEVGTGTDPTEGSALASAVLLKLRDKGALVFASTHHGSLKLIANSESGFINAAMEFDHEQLKPTYKFKLGIPGSSYAFEIARRIGVDEKLIDTAAGMMDSDKLKLEVFLSEIEAKSNRLEEKLKHIEIENTRLTGLSDLYKTNIGRLEKEKREILKKAKSDAEDFLKTVNKKVESTIKEIRESGAQKNVIKETKKIIDELKAEAQNLYSPEVVTEINISDFRVGNFVMIRETSTQGRILQIDSARNKALIESGSIKMQVNLSELVIANASKETKAENHHHNLQNIIPQHRLDIRGRKPEEVDFEIIKFLDDSYMNGQDRIEILHGKGTGALKKTVRDILDKHEKVKNYYFAPIEFGGEGITIVELK